jgi:8-oxo-dGTP pyrophosphatase MutT (NUDIX family)
MPELTGSFVREGLKEVLARPAVRLDLEQTASVAVILRMASEGPVMLFIKRTENPNDPWSGHMGFPGGRYEPGDESTRRTAEREAQEETGLSLSTVGEHLGLLDHQQARTRGGPQPLKVVPHVFWLGQDPALDLDRREIASAHWIPLTHFFDPSNRTTYDAVMQERKLELPAYGYRGLVIWGLSHRILTDFLDRIRSTRLGAGLQSGS